MKSIERKDSQKFDPYVKISWRNKLYIHLMRNKLDQI